MPVSQAARMVTRYREALGWSKRRLAREAGISAPYVVQMENGERPVTARMLVRMALALSVPPYILLTQAGFIPIAHMEEAHDMADKAMAIPSLRDHARGATDSETYHWLTADYLLLLGDDPYGKATDAGLGPSGPALDWTPLVPDAPPTMAAHLMGATLGLGSRTPPSVEGWDDLTEGERKALQQVANQFLRNRAAEANPDGDAEA